MLGIWRSQEVPGWCFMLNLRDWLPKVGVCLSPWQSWRLLDNFEYIKDRLLLPCKLVLSGELLDDTGGLLLDWCVSNCIWRFLNNFKYPLHYKSDLVMIQRMLEVPDLSFMLNLCSGCLLCWKRWCEKPPKVFKWVSWQ